MAHNTSSLHSVVSSLSSTPSTVGTAQSAVATTPPGSSSAAIPQPTTTPPPPPTPPLGTPPQQNIPAANLNTNSSNAGFGTAAIPQHVPANNPGTPNAQHVATNSATAASSKKHNQTRLSHYFDDWWAWEILAGLFGTLCLLAIIVVLVMYDRHPQPELRWGITLNAIVALITTAMKGALLTPLMEGMSQFKWIAFAERERPLMDFNVYDGASRGGLNALMLFWHLRKRFWREVTALAAIFYFLSFGVDTFVQQLIQVEFTDLATESSEAFLLRSQRYDTYYLPYADQGNIQPYGPDSDMNGAIYTGLYSPTLPDQDVFRCPESNCTYPNTPSLAICGKCNDLSSQIVEVEGVGGTGYRLPQGPELGGNLYWNVTSTANVSETNSFTDLGPIVVSFAYINTTYTTNDIPKAGECSLYLCVQEFTAEVRRGRLNQTVVREWTYIAPRPITNDTDIATGVWSYWWDIKIDTQGMEGPSAGMDFNFSIQAYLAMQKAMLDLLKGDAYSSSQSVEEGLYFSSDPIRRLYFESNMSGLVDRLSSSMTASIRRSPAPYAMVPLGVNITEATQLVPYPIPAYPGKSVQQLPFVRIAWPWIILPAITVLFSNVFLIYAMMRTRQARRILDIGVWKSSSLPVLYHGLDADALVRAAPDPALSTSVAYMEENANQLRVRLNLARNEIRLS